MRQADAPRTRRGQSGVSLVEIMVGVVIALLVSLAASGSAAVFTASQRQGIGAGGMTVNAATAMSAIKNDAASAGLGFFGDSAFRCWSMDFSVGAAVKLDDASFSPVRITAGATAADSDQLEVMYASNVDSGANVLLKGTSDGGSASLLSLLPANTGQAVLLVPKTPAASGKPCVVRSVTAVAASTDEAPQTLTFANTGTFNGAPFTVTPSFRQTDGDRVALLGDLQWSRYSVSGGNLSLTRPITGDSAVLVRNVMAFRAQYGIRATTAATDTTLSGWQDATASTIWQTLGGANVERVRAVRIGLVTRSPQREKPNAAGTCEASSAKPTLFGVTVEPDVSDWQCYRYRTAVVVVPLRNLW